MRRPFIAGNWKMTQTRAEAVALAEGIVQQLGKSDIEVAVAPPSVYLDAVGQVTKGSGVGLSAQNMYHEANGAFTGEIKRKHVAGRRLQVCDPRPQRAAAYSRRDGRRCES